MSPMQACGRNAASKQYAVGSMQKVIRVREVENT
jgi:hypothetical protein